MINLSLTPARLSDIVLHWRRNTSLTVDGLVATHCHFFLPRAVSYSNVAKICCVCVCGVSVSVRTSNIEKLGIGLENEARGNVNVSFYKHSSFY